MKKLVLLLLLFVIPVAAVNYNRDFVGGVSRSQFTFVTCEREKKLGASNTFNERVCCINLNKNAYCENDEPVLGTCAANACFWPTKSFTPWYSWRYRSTPCSGLAVMAGKEYDALLEWSGCDRTDVWWCCSPVSFPTFEGKPMVEPKVEAKSSPTGALLVLDGSKWKALELGYFKWLKPEQRALAYEKNRCALGGGSVRIVDPKYGSFFSDTRNLRPGVRAFYLTEKEVVPLITSCD